jgi:hypothetical protein
VTGEARDEAQRVALGLGAPTLVAVLFLAFLGHRSDYVGHYLAGFGATLGALGLATLVRSHGQRASVPPLATLGIVLASIGAGALLEVSVFRIARFDPVDFANQSLGAVFAGAAALAADARGETSHAVRTAGAIAAVSATLAGFWFAFA